jgi:hypothetical protein
VVRHRVLTRDPNQEGTVGSSKVASQSNRPWTDSEATGLADGGEASKGKRTLLDAFSLLVLNNEIVQGHIDAWTEAGIRERSTSITESTTAVWPGSSGKRQEAALEAARS